jgi:hypothetical protein
MSGGVVDSGGGVKRGVDDPGGRVIEPGGCAVDLRGCVKSRYSGRGLGRGGGSTVASELGSGKSSGVCLGVGVVDSRHPAPTFDSEGGDGPDASGS